MAIPAGNHTDWQWPFSMIPRSANAIEGLPVTRTIAKSANLDKEDDIPNPGAWILQTSKYGVYFALTTAGRWHFRLGSYRLDLVDGYTTFPTFTVKKLKPHPDDPPAAPAE